MLVFSDINCYGRIAICGCHETSIYLRGCLKRVSYPRPFLFFNCSVMDIDKLLNYIYLCPRYYVCITWNLGPRIFAFTSPIQFNLSYGSWSKLLLLFSFVKKNCLIMFQSLTEVNHFKLIQLVQIDTLNVCQVASSFDMGKGECKLDWKF